MDSLVAIGINKVTYVMNALLMNLDRLHTTERGVFRIRKNLGLDEGDVVAWCSKQIMDSTADINRMGKNWYIEVNQCRITVNASSYTIITAHRMEMYHSDLRKKE